MMKGTQYHLQSLGTLMAICIVSSKVTVCKSDVIDFRIELTPRFPLGLLF